MLHSASLIHSLTSFVLTAFLGRIPKQGKTGGGGGSFLRGGKKEEMNLSSIEVPETESEVVEIIKA